MSEETDRDGPVDYDDRNDPDCPTSAGEAIINAIGFTGAIEVAEHTDEHTIFVWKANAAEQIEARMAEIGWKVERSRPWKVAEVG